MFWVLKFYSTTPSTVARMAEWDANMDSNHTIIDFILHFRKWQCLFFKSRLSGWCWKFKIFNSGWKFLCQFLSKCRRLQLVYIRHKEQHVFCFINVSSSCDWRMPRMPNWPGVNFINILRAAFSYESLLSSFSALTF